MRLLLRSAAALTCLLLLTACQSESATTADPKFEQTRDGTRLVEPGFRTVLRVDLQPDTTFQDLSELQEKYRNFSGVASVGGGVGEGVANAMLIFSPDATKDDVVAVREALSDESRVEQVAVEHRK